MRARFAVLFLMPLVLLAADPFYIGTWKIASTATAPWSTRDLPPDEPERTALMGQIVTFKSNEIAGPRQVACKDPKYKVVNVPPEGLFQGSFDEMHQHDKSIDPAKEAAKVGFHGKSFKTLQTGCAIEIDWHFIDPTTTTFGLNNVIYTLKKQ